MIRNTFGLILIIIGLMSYFTGLLAMIFSFPWGIYHFVSVAIEGQALWVAALHSAVLSILLFVGGGTLAIFGFSLCFLFKEGYIK